MSSIDFDFWPYKWVPQIELEQYFFDVDAIKKYGENIIPVYHFFNPFNRVWAHIIYWEKQYIIDTAQYWKYTSEISQELPKILTREKNIDGLAYYPLVDNKTDQTREYLDYVVKKGIQTKIYIYAPDYMFWFFHDLWHGYLADKIDNFYDNVYGYPEQLVNLFAAIKLKQYWKFNKQKVIYEAVTKCYRYEQINKDYFRAKLDVLWFSDDF